MTAGGSYAPKHARDICESQGGVYLQDLLVIFRICSSPPSARRSPAASSTSVIFVAAPIGAWTVRERTCRPRSACRCGFTGSIRRREALLTPLGTPTTEARVLRAGLARVVLILGTVAVATGDPVPAVVAVRSCLRCDRRFARCRRSGCVQSVAIATVAGSR
jgi:hypothetical protein